MPRVRVSRADLLNLKDEETSGGNQPLPSAAGLWLMGRGLAGAGRDSVSVSIFRLTDQPKEHSREETIIKRSHISERSSEGRGRSSGSKRVAFTRTL